MYNLKFLTVSLLLLITNNLFATDQQEADAIRTVLLEQEKAWNEGKLEDYMQGYWKSEKLRFASEGKYKFGWQKTLDGYKKGYPSKEKMGKLNFTIYDIDIISVDAALVFGAWQLQRKDDQPHGLFTLLFKKIPDQGWRIVADHTSSASNP